MHEQRLTRRQGIAALAGAGLTIWSSRSVFARQATPAAAPVDAARDWTTERWVGSWSAGMHIPGPGFGEEFPSQIFDLSNRTLRQIARTSIGGDQVRIRLSNTFGDGPIEIGAARIALRDADQRIDPGSDQPVTFSGLPSVTIPAGATVVSDPVALPLPDLAELAVSLHFPKATTSTTVHGFAFQSNYISTEGDHTGEAALPVDSTIQSWAFLSGVDVAGGEPAGAVVALGDSITDGAFSTPDTNRRWPDVLAERLVADGARLGVLNQGIGGNRLLNDPPAEFPFFGPSALARFDRDVLALPSVSHLIVFEGINDIGLPLMVGEPSGGDATPQRGETSQEVSADQMIAALRQLAERAHEHGIVAIGATITPFAGAMYYSPEGEAKRQAVNEWIRGGGAFDAVIDFDAVVRDPDQPTQILPAFDGGDHLHINDAGFQAMAESIDLSIFAAP